MKLIFLFILIGYQTIAQQGTVANGNDITSTNGTVNYFVGQISYSYLENSSISVNQGLQQPYEFLTAGLNTFEEYDIELIIYPNPISEVLILSLKKQEENLSLKIFNSEGKELINKNILELNTEIELKELSSAIYFISIYRKDQPLGIYQFLKN